MGRVADPGEPFDPRASFLDRPVGVPSDLFGEPAALRPIFADP